MSYTIVRRDFLKCALAAAVAIPVLGPVDARATDLPPLDPSDPVAQSLGFVPMHRKSPRTRIRCSSLGNSAAYVCNIRVRHPTP